MNRHCEAWDRRRPSESEEAVDRWLAESLRPAAEQVERVRRGALAEGAGTPRCRAGAIRWWVAPAAALLASLALWALLPIGKTAEEQRRGSAAARRLPVVVTGDGELGWRIANVATDDGTASTGAPPRFLLVAARQRTAGPDASELSSKGD
ncbi:MAG: hypothetical protein DWQ36_09645 [Acidobacteria bacterium]|nr:MAG: hypothetical protein DWQ30_00925 [Acidobacteriota bacterium]REK08324.1 MAG: hypothetical protein DWQ36_09645 [Acidobacteriota bacterium]